MGGGVQTAAQTWQPRTAACWAVVSSGAVGVGLAPVVGSVPSPIVSAGTPIIVRSSDRPIPFLGSKSWSAWSVVRLCPKKAEEAPKPSIVCRVSDQFTVTSCDFDDEQARRLAGMVSASARGRSVLMITSSQDPFVKRRTYHPADSWWRANYAQTARKSACGEPHFAF